MLASHGKRQSCFPVRGKKSSSISLGTLSTCAKNLDISISLELIVLRYERNNPTKPFTFALDTGRKKGMLQVFVERWLVFLVEMKGMRSLEKG